MIQNKKYLVVFHKHKINSLLDELWYAWFGFFFFFGSLWKIEYFGTLVNISFNLLKFSLYNLHFLKALKT